MDPLLEHLYHALRTPFGIVIRTEDAEKLRQKLYALRKKVEDPALVSLSFLISPFIPTELWIVKRPLDEEH